jgi:hypothetical protein
VQMETAEYGGLQNGIFSDLVNDRFLKSPAVSKSIYFVVVNAEKIRLVITNDM